MKAVFVYSGEHTECSPGGGAKLFEQNFETTYVTVKFNKLMSNHSH